jgi:hypothetical protein
MEPCMDGLVDYVRRQVALRYDFSNPLDAIQIYSRCYRRLVQILHTTKP